MTAGSTWQVAAVRLTAALHLNVAPIAITFSNTATHAAPPFIDPSTPMPEPTSDGRTGRVPAGCVCWLHALDRTSTTRPEAHGTCSGGSLTHGLIDLDTATRRADVAALVESGWVTPAIFPAIPTVATRSKTIVYGPLAD